MMAVQLCAQEAGTRRGVKEEREERERERSQRVDFKFSQNFQLKLEKV